MSYNYDGTYDNIAANRTRDPARIDAYMGELRAFWKMHPNMRLCQIVELVASWDGAGGVKKTDIFMTEDDEFFEKLPHYPYAYDCGAEAPVSIPEDRFARWPSTVNSEGA